VCALTLCLLLVGCNRTPEAKEAQHLSRGKSLLEKKDFARALLEFRSASQLKPKDAEPYYQAGLAYLYSGNLASSVAAFRKAVSLDPNHTGAELKLAELMTASSNKNLIEQALERLEKIISISTDNAEATDALALAELKLGETDEAVQHLEAILQRFPSHLDSSVMLARVRLAKKDVMGAEEVLRKAVLTAPNSAQAALALGEFYLATKNSAKAEATVEQAIHLDPKSGPALLALAGIQVSDKRWADAERTYTRISQLSEPQYKPLHAIYLYSRGDRKRALHEFEELYKHDPNDRGARTRLLSVYVELGQMEDAKKVLDTALKKNRKDSDALLVRSALELKSGQILEAERDLNEVLHYQPDSAKAHLGLAEVYRTQGLKRNQRQELHEVLRLQPEMAEARITLARDLLATHEAKAALEVLNETPSKQKDLLGVIIQRNWALLGTHATAELDAELKRDLQAERRPEFLIQEAALKLAQKDPARARQSAEEALKLRPNDVRAIRAVVDSFVAQKQPDKAEFRLRQIAGTQQDASPVQYFAAQWYRDHGKLEDARKAAEQAKSTDPRYLEAELLLAEIDRDTKHVDAAKQRVQKVIAENPKNVSAQMLMAELQESTGNGDTAMKIYQTVLNVDHSNALALNNLAYHMAAEKPDEALKMAQEAVELDPNNPAIADTLGWAYFHKGLYDSALGYLNKAFEQKPSAHHQYHLAMCQIKAGKKELGDQNLRAALKKDPNVGKER